MPQIPPVSGRPLRSFALRSAEEIVAVPPGTTDLSLPADQLDLQAVARADLRSLHTLHGVGAPGLPWRITPADPPLPALQAIYLHGAAGLTDLRRLAGLPPLERIMVHGAADLRSSALPGRAGAIYLLGAAALEALDGPWPGTRSISVTGCGALRTLEGAPAPDPGWLSLDGAARLDDLSPIAARFPALVSLHLSGLRALRRLSLRGMPLLREIRLSDAPALDQLDLQDLPALRTLQIDTAPTLARLALSDLPDLRALTVLRAPALRAWSLRLPALISLFTLDVPLTDLSPLADLPALTSLTVRGAAPDPDTLPALPALAELELSGDHPVARVEHLALSRPGLRRVRLGPHARDLSQLLWLRSGAGARLSAAVPGLGAASWLEVLGTLEGLSGLPALDLRLAASVGRGRWMLRPRPDCAPLCFIRPGFHQTAALWLAATLGQLTPGRLRIHPEVCCLPTLRQFQRLRQLKIVRCPHLTDLSPLIGLDALEELILDGSPFADLSPLRSLPALRRISLIGCAGVPEGWRRVWEGGAAQSLRDRI